MRQKIIQIGNSIGTIIPQILSRDLKLVPGDELEVEKKDNKLILTPLKRKKLAYGVDAKFMKMVDEFAKEHEDVLNELSKR